MSTAYPVKPVQKTGLGLDRAVLDDLLPPWGDIPEEFRRRYSPWCDLVDAWFFDGLASIDSPVKAGIDRRSALQHLSAIMHSFAPPHEHKTAGVAFLLSQWFDGPPKWTVKE